MSSPDPTPDAAPVASLLAVDDEPGHLAALSDVLSHEGYRVVCCASGEQALDHLREGVYDVLLSDLMMPGMDGIELMRLALARDADLVPVLMTGHGSIDSAVAAMKVGAIDYVLKPLRMSALRPVLHRALEMRRLRVHNRVLQQRLSLHAKRLERANRDLDAFAMRIAHDLRGPLQVIAGFAQAANERLPPDTDAEVRRMLDRVMRAGERGDDMVRDLLRLARLGDGTLKLAAVDLDAVVAAAVESLQEQADGRAVDWVILPLPQVQGDASLLQQVFVNLLSNALKFTRPCERARIEVVCVDDAVEGHRITVRDNGVGFDPAYADRLFTPFQRLHARDAFEGHGIGLSSVKRIVERHGGTVSATSQPGQGAAFTITLPAGAN